VREIKGRKNEKTIKKINYTIQFRDTTVPPTEEEGRCGGVRKTAVRSKIRSTRNVS
jgi:hypothetical protein